MGLTHGRQASGHVVGLLLVLASGCDQGRGTQGYLAYRDSAGTVVRAHPAATAIVPETARLERLAAGFVFAEGPVWVGTEGRPHLTFSDLRANALYRWYPSGALQSLEEPLYRGPRRRNSGPNGLTLDAEGRLVICDTGNRRVVRLERDGRQSVLADRHRGRRLNSPNDLVFRSDGSLYFTDPPYGLPKEDQDPAKEVPFSGVFRLRPDGSLDVLTEALSWPNGIAFSPDERVLYLTNKEGRRDELLAYEVRDDGTLGDSHLLRDLTADGGGDGIKVDRTGNVYVATAAGVQILEADGTLLGTIVPEESPSNLAWGDGGRTLYITAQTGLYRIALNASGIRTRPD